jgi:hypothetical protein
MRHPTLQQPLPRTRPETTRAAALVAGEERERVRVRQGGVRACAALQWETAIESVAEEEFEIRNGAKRSSGTEARFISCICVQKPRLSASVDRDSCRCCDSPYYNLVIFLFLNFAFKRIFYVLYSSL